MASFTDYSNKMAQRYAALLPEAVAPVLAYRGPRYATREMERVQENLDRDRKRAVESRIRERLDELAQVQLACRAPFGEPLAVRGLVQSEHRLILLSEAGAGKTTVLRDLAAHPFNENMLTVLVDLPALTASELSLPEYLAQDAQENLGLEEVTAEFFAAALRGGHIVVCMDGLDEIAGAQSRTKMVRRIETWAAQFARARFVVTARSNATEVALSSDLFARFVLQPWSDHVAADLEAAWNASLDAWTVEGRAANDPSYAERHRLWQDLAMAMREQGVSCATVEQARMWLAGAAEKDGALGLNKRRAQRAAETLLQESVSHLDLIAQEQDVLGFSSRLLQDILVGRAIASRVADGVDSAWAGIALRLWDTTWRQPLLFAFRFLSQSDPALWAEFLLGLVDAGEKDALEAVLHRHLILAAQALAASDLAQALDPQVQQRIVDGLFAWLSDASAAGRQDAVDLLFALAGVTSATDGALQFGQAAIDAAKTLAAREAEAEAKAKAAKEAKEAKAAEAVAKMKAAQAAGELEKAREIAMAAREEAEAEEVEVVDIFEGVLDSWARQAAGLLLGRLGRARKKEAADVLQEMVENDDEKNVLVRKAAAMSLGQLFLGMDSGAAEYAALGAAIRNKMMGWARGNALPIDVRGVVADALGQLLIDGGQGDLLDTFIFLARGVSEEEKITFTIQIAAAKALNVMAQTVRDDGLNARLWELVADEQVDPSVRIELAETLGKLGREKEVAALLLEMGLNTKLRYIDQRDAFDALGRVGYADPEIIEKVQSIAQTTDRKYKDFVRLAAAHALEGLGERPLSIQFVLQLVADKSIYRSTRHDAFTLVGEAGLSGIEALDEATVAILRVWAKEENTTEDIRERAIESLTMLGVTDKEFVQDLISVLQNKREYRRVRQKAAWALGALPQDWAEPACEGLQSVLYDPDEKNDVLRVEIARSVLRFMEEQPAVDYLKAVTEQAYMAQARHDAALVLLEYGMIEDAIEPLLLMVLTPEIADRLRRSAVHTLGVCAAGNEEVIQGLRRVFDQPELEPNVRQETYDALMAIAAV
ncbi:MAG: hypothetical protein JXA89_11040 [Anaerolineae bacterium]|nr:hypothetical protein [Anaerolineae bacterium]